jgi:hypothetical protein
MSNLSTVGREGGQLSDVLRGMVTPQYMRWTRHADSTYTTNWVDGIPVSYDDYPPMFMRMIDPNSSFVDSDG